jgi:pimeloyl-ACP methyl ester carboxylesterase
MSRTPQLLFVGLILAAIASASRSDEGEPKSAQKPEGDAKPIFRSLPATKQPNNRDAINLPKYANGRLTTSAVHGRFAFLIEPTGRVDSQRRWVWTFPFEQALADAHGKVQQRFYVEKLLASGFHVAGINVGVSCGSPAAAAVCDEFYKVLVSKHGLNKRARLIGQSNGGLIAYAWAFRHPECVDRIAGIYPATDLRTWPGLAQAVTYPAKGLDYGLMQGQLTARLTEFNPIDNLRPLAKAGVKILHIHGDADRLVPMDKNSTELACRYREFGGQADLIVLKGLAHGGASFFTSTAFADFLLAD